MEKGRHYRIIAGGKVCFDNIPEVSPDDIIWVAADSGAAALLSNGIMPDILVGDLDSIAEKDSNQIKNDGQTEIFRFPAEKDMSDTYLALQLVSLLEDGGPEELWTEWAKYHIPAAGSKFLKKWQRMSHITGLAQVDILGASGSRPDHSLANYWIAYGFVSRLNITYWQEKSLAYPCVGKTVKYFKKNPQYPYFSILPVSEQICGLTLTGFRYPLFNAKVRQEEASLLLSNEIIDENAFFSITAGKVLIFRTKD